MDILQCIKRTIVTSQCNMTDILLFNKKSYKFSISVGRKGKTMHTVNGVFDTCTGLSLVRERFLEAEWLNSLQANNRPSFKNATNQKVNIVRTVMLPVQIVESRVTLATNVVRSLPHPVLLSVFFIDRFVNGILQGRGWRVAWRKVFREKHSLRLVYVAKQAVIR